MTKPIFKKVRSDTDIQDIQCPMSIDLSLATSAKISDMPVLEKVLDKAMTLIRNEFKSNGFQVYYRTGLVKPMTQEELLTIIPRKMHFERDGKQICRTEFVARKNLTVNPDEVTCKLCLKVLE